MLVRSETQKLIAVQVQGCDGSETFVSTQQRVE
jgi:hypothetical protein